MDPNLGFPQLKSLIETVFRPGRGEKGLTILTDLPDNRVRDTPEWRDRRNLCSEWYHALNSNRDALPFDQLSFYSYKNVGTNNNDLPPEVWRVEEGEEPGPTPIAVPLDAVLQQSSVIIAPTELSATAPLKLLAKRHLFRAATLPGFARSMLPSLGLDYEKVHARVMQIKERMDMAESILVRFAVPGSRYEMVFDTRFRAAHASGGLMREPGQVGNLPSGEAYIVPYEGETLGTPSLTSGCLPVQFDSEIVLYRIKDNKAWEINSIGARSMLELAKLREEPAYGNIAEVGIGVLGEWGVQACGNILMDEKLGLHIAFGRSDHFGGSTSPASFRNAHNVIHIDRVYVPSLQPRIKIEGVRFDYIGGENELIMENGVLIV